jgi:hypothetical protein
MFKKVSKHWWHFLDNSSIKGGDIKGGRLTRDRKK